MTHKSKVTSMTKIVVVIETYMYILNSYLNPWAIRCQLAVAIFPNVKDYPYSLVARGCS